MDADSTKAKDQARRCLSWSFRRSPDGIRTRATALREQPPEDTFPQVKAHSVASPGVSAHSRCTANPAHAHIGGSDRKRYAATCNGVSRLRRPDGADSHSSPATVTAPRLRRRTGNLEDDRAARAVCPDVAAARAPNDSTHPPRRRIPVDVKTESSIFATAARKCAYESRRSTKYAVSNRPLIGLRMENGEGRSQRPMHPPGTATCTFPRITSLHPDMPTRIHGCRLVLPCPVFTRSPTPNLPPRAVPAPPISRPNANRPIRSRSLSPPAVVTGITSVENSGLKPASSRQACVARPCG